MNESPFFPAAASSRVPQFGMFERWFRHSGRYDNPYRDLSARAYFRRPDGMEWEIPLFWDGDADWGVRVSPDLAGKWTYVVRSPDAGLNGCSGSFECMASGLRGSIRPMSGRPRHFEYQNGTPFFFFGEKAWRVLQTDPSKNLDRAAAMHHVDVRAAQGFTYMHTELAGTGGLTSGGNEGGEMFLDAGCTSINPAFFREVDDRVRHINEQGLVLGIVLLYSIGSPCWFSLPDDEARMRFVRYVVARYAAYHVVFIVTGEWQFKVVHFDLFNRIGRELRATDPHGRMLGIHPGPGPYFSSQDFASEDWCSFGEYAQAYFAPDREEAADWCRDDLRDFTLAARRHSKPVVHAEYAYYLRDQDFDGVVDKPNSHTRDSFRRASWVIPMAGAYFVTGFGTTYFGGRREVGPFLVDDPRHAAAIADLGRIRDLFTSLEWWKLEPHDECVTSPEGYAYCVADPGSVYIVYTAGSSGTELKLGEERYTIHRLDPRTGDRLALSPVEENTGGTTVRLEVPDRQDWVFVARAAESGC